MKRRTNGEGTTYKETKNGKTYYRKQITVTDKYGNKKRKSFSAKTSAELHQKVADFYEKQKQEIRDQQEDANILLRDWIYRYLYDYKYNTVKYNTIARYLTQFEKHLLPYDIANMKLKDIKTIDAQRYIDELYQKTGSLENTKQTKQILSASLNYAVKLDILKTNRVRHATLPQEKDYKKATEKTAAEKYEFLELSEQETLLQNLPKNRYGTAILFDFATGLRRGELLALTWDDIDMENCQVTINKSLTAVYIKDRDGIRKHIKKVTTPKTPTSNRTIPYPKKLNAALYQIKLQQMNDRKKYKDIYKENAIVFCDEIGDYLDIKRLPRLFSRTLQKSGLKHIKFHAIRHCYATRLFENGVDIKTVAFLLGHKDTKITEEIYTHVTKKTLKEAENIIQNIV